MAKEVIEQTGLDLAIMDHVQDMCDQVDQCHLQTGLYHLTSAIIRPDINKACRESVSMF